MNKKAILKKYVGKGGPYTAQTFRDMQQKDDSLANKLGSMKLDAKKAPSPFKMIGNAVKSGVNKYKNFAAKENRLNKAASDVIGNVSSNQYNMDRMSKIKKQLRKSGNY